MKHKILSLFLNTFTVNDKHYLRKRENLTQPIQMQLSEKEKTFCQFFILFLFLKSILNFKHLPTKDDLVADVFLEIPAPKNMVR